MSQEQPRRARTTAELSSPRSDASREWLGTGGLVCWLRWGTTALLSFGLGTGGLVCWLRWGTTALLSFGLGTRFSTPNTQI